MAVLQSAIFKLCCYSRCLHTAKFSTTSYLSKQSVEEKLGLQTKPKKPQTPFFRFLAKVRPELMQKQPDMKTTEIAKIAAEKWKHIDEVTKKSLQKEFEEDVLKYQEKLKEYDLHLSPGDRDLILLEKENIKLRKEKIQLKKKKEILGRPKRPLTSFLLFIQSKASERGDVTYKKWLSIISEQWKSLSEAEKAPFIEQQNKEMAIYKRKLEQWEKEVSDKSLGQVLRS